MKTKNETRPFPKKTSALLSRFVLRTGTKGPPASAPQCGHVEHLWSQFVSQPGLKVIGISPDRVVPVVEPGLKALWNRDCCPVFY